MISPLKKAILLTFIAIVIIAPPGAAEILNSFSSPATRPKDLAWDGSYLWNIDYWSNLIYKIDPSNGSVVHTIPSPHPSYPNGLAWDGNNLWVGAGNSNCMIYKINPQNGDVITSFPAPNDSYPSGLACRLFKPG